MDEQPAAKTGPHLLDEADVGSGEKSPGQQETEALIDKIGERPTPSPAEPALNTGAGIAPDPDQAVAPAGIRAPADGTAAGPP